MYSLPAAADEADTSPRAHQVPGCAATEGPDTAPHQASISGRSLRLHVELLGETS